MEKAEKTIKRFDLFSRDEPVVVAYSGGKDSIALLDALGRLNYDVRPVVIDMGYKNFPLDDIVEVARGLGFDPKVIEPRCQAFLTQLKGAKREKVEENFRNLDALDVVAQPNATPCTGCYDNKLVGLLEYAQSIGSSKVAFGHHGTDAVASLLKSAFMYLDHHENGSATYDKERFRSFVESHRSVLSQDYDDFAQSEFARRLGELVDEEKAGTDEPPMEIKNGVCIVRPFYEVLEREVIDLKKDYDPQGSGCSHGQSELTYTAREVVHFGMLRELEKTDSGEKVVRSLIELASSQLNPDGTLGVRVRNQRNVLMPGYKDSIKR